MDCTICVYRIRRALERPWFLTSNHFTQYICINYTANFLFLGGDCGYWSSQWKQCDGMLISRHSKAVMIKKTDPVDALGVITALNNQMHHTVSHLTTGF